MSMKRFAVLASGGGTNLQALIDATGAGRIAGDLAVVISNRPRAFALERARRAGIAAVAHNHKRFASREAFEAAIEDTLAAHDVELVVLAGFMRVLTAGFVRRWRGRLVNTHPALLPSFAGAHGVADALAYGVKVTGITVHFVDEGVDTGPIIAQATVPVSAGDTAGALAERLKAVEHRLFPRVVDQLLRGRIRIGVGRIVDVPAGALEVEP